MMPHVVFECEVSKDVYCLIIIVFHVRVLTTSCCILTSGIWYVQTSYIGASIRMSTLLREYGMYHVAGKSAQYLIRTYLAPLVFKAGCLVAV